MARKDLLDDVAAWARAEGLSGSVETRLVPPSSPSLKPGEVDLVLVMSVGVAGGFRAKGAEIGTVYISRDTIRYFDRRVSIKTPNYHDYAIGYYPVADASEMAAAPVCCGGRVKRQMGAEK